MKYIEIQEVYINGTLMYSSDNPKDIVEYVKLQNKKDEISIKKRRKRITGRSCRRCGGPVYISDIPGYRFQCFKCDEDFCDFEVK